MTRSPTQAKAIKRRLLAIVTMYCKAEKAGKVRAATEALDTMDAFLAAHGLDYHPMDVVEQGRALMRRTVAGSRAAVY